MPPKKNFYIVYSPAKFLNDYSCHSLETEQSVGCKCKVQLFSYHFGFLLNCWSLWTLLRLVDRVESTWPVTDGAAPWAMKDIQLEPSFQLSCTQTEALKYALWLSIQREEFSPCLKQQTLEHSTSLHILNLVTKILRLAISFITHRGGQAGENHAVLRLSKRKVPLLGAGTASIRGSGDLLDYTYKVGEGQSTSKLREQSSKQVKTHSEVLRNAGRRQSSGSDGGRWRLKGRKAAGLLQEDPSVRKTTAVDSSSGKKQRG